METYWFPLYEQPLRWLVDTRDNTLVEVPMSITWFLSPVPAMTGCPHYQSVNRKTLILASNSWFILSSHSFINRETKYQFCNIPTNVFSYKKTNDHKCSWINFTKYYDDDAPIIIAKLANGLLVVSSIINETSHPWYTLKVIDKEHFNGK